MSRDIVWKAGESGAKPAPTKPRVQGGIKVRTGIRIGGTDPGGNHNRRALALARAHRKRIAEADRLLAAADVQIARRERVIERVRRELGRS